VECAIAGYSSGVIVRSITAQAQWLNFQTPNVPRTKDGKPNLSAPAPRIADGNRVFADGRILPNADIFESFCENERDRAHLEAAKPKP
jgi:hypothetical protein